tara:strand:+ start:97264 stop:98064 length:801 start_codon:yes stop_codon:yes gene_type:complete
LTNDNKVPDRQDKTGPDKTETTAGAQVIAKSARVMRTLEQHPQGLNLNQLVAETGMPRSTLHRLCSALQEERFLRQDNGLWRLGPGLAQLAASAHQDIVSVIRPVLEKLGRRTRETVDLCVYRGAHAVLVDQFASDQELRVVSAPGTAFPVHMTAHGKAMLAAMDDQETESLFPDGVLPRRTDASHGNLADLLAELKTIRQHGVAVDLQEHGAGVCAIGTVLKTGTPELYAMSLAVPDLRFERDLESLRSGLLQAKAEIEALLGQD